MIAAVQKRGLAFKVSPELEKRLKDNEVSDEVIKALQAAPVKEPQPNDSPYKKETRAGQRRSRRRLSKKRKLFLKAFMAVR